MRGSVVDNDVFVFRAVQGNQAVPATDIAVPCGAARSPACTFASGRLLLSHAVSGSARIRPMSKGIVSRGKPRFLADVGVTMSQRMRAVLIRNQSERWLIWPIGQADRN